jgi:hypothetical protein
MSCDDMFFFGAHFGDGTDADHFHVGMTSIGMLKPLLDKRKKLYHLDATYKILKYYFPLIVFGYTDCDHVFYPAAFMITSHEETKDYRHFFKSLNRLIESHFDQKFEPEFIMSDAGKSINKAIRLTYENTTKLMCFFHVMHNVIFWF